MTVEEKKQCATPNLSCSMDKRKMNGASQVKPNSIANAGQKKIFNNMFNNFHDILSFQKNVAWF